MNGHLFGAIASVLFVLGCWLPFVAVTVVFELRARAERRRGR